MYRSVSILLLLALLYAGHARAQHLPEDAALQYWQLLPQQGSSGGLFVHLDKRIYTNNEQLWFSAYFLNRLSPCFAQQEFIAVALISAQTRRVYLEAKFAAGEGFSFGNIAIPDTVPPGNYLFTAFGNCTGRSNTPLAFYRQLITIKSIVRNGFRADIRMVDSLSSGANAVVQVKAEDLSRQPIKKAAVLYTTDGKNSSRAVTNDSGLVYITLPRHATPGIVQVRVNYDNEFQLLSALIPPSAADTAPAVHFYPESGSMMPAAVSRILMQVKTAAGKPVAGRAVLFRNRVAEDTLVVNSAGLCSFSVIPFETDTLYVQLMRNGRTTDSTRWLLPPPDTAAAVISTDKGVFGDTLAFLLSSAVPAEALLFVYTQEQLLHSSRIALSQQRKKIILPLQPSGIPDGICTVALTDTSGRLLARRLFLHRGRQPQLMVQTDRQEYTRHEQVTLKIRLDSAWAAGAVVVSAAAVQESRLARYSSTDIEDFQLLQPAFGNKPPVAGRMLDDRNSLEQLLLLPDSAAAAGPEPQQYDSLPNQLQVKGTLRIDGKKPKKPQQLLVFADSAIAVTETDSAGVFVLAPQLITVAQGRRLVLGVNSNADKKIIVTLSSEFAEIAERLAAGASLEAPEPAANAAALKPVPDEFPVAKRLKEVVVKARRNDYGTGPGGMGANECGDYICFNRILNCPNHYNDFANRPPRPGEMVYEGTSFRNAAVYKGCAALNRNNSGTVKIPGIYTTKEFFGVEQAQKDVSEPEYRSTLFWKPGIVLQPGMDAGFSFLTSDITGWFKVIVQGVAADGSVVYKEARFRVVY